MQVELTAEAKADIRRISNYIAEDNPIAADAWTRRVQQRCQSLANAPLRYALIPRHEASGIRRRPFGNYLIFYRVKTDAVQVLHVIHGAQDYEPLLFPDS